MNNYQDVLAGLTAAVAAQVEIILASWRTGELLLSEAIDLIVGFIIRAESQSAIASVVAVNSLMPEAEQVRQIELPELEVHDEQVVKAVATVLKDLPDDPTEDDVDRFDKRLQRLAKGRVTETAGRVIDKGIAKASRDLANASSEAQIVGYTRGLDKDPCELCVWLKKEHLRPGGFIYPAGQPMHRHPGCCCVPVPVTKKEKTA